MTVLPALVVRAATIDPSPSPTDVLRPGLDPYDVSPGLLGFLAVFFLAVVCVLGWRSLNSKVRRIRFEERVAAAEAAWEREEAAGGVLGDVVGPLDAEAEVEDPAAAGGGDPAAGDRDAAADAGGSVTGDASRDRD